MAPSCEERTSLDWEMGGQFRRPESWNDMRRPTDSSKDSPKLFTLKFRHLAIFTLRLVGVTF